MGRFVFAVAILTLACLGVASAETDVGVQLGAGTATSRSASNTVSVNGGGEYVIVELTQHVDRFRLHLEGVPPLRVSTSTRGAYGSSKVGIDFVNATALVDLDARGRLRAGVGLQLVDVSAFYGTSGFTRTVRSTSSRFEIDAELPAAHRHFFELSFVALPNVRELRRDRDIFNVASPDRSAVGSELDYSVGYGWRGGAMRYLVGLRGFSYGSRSVLDGSLVDHTAGGGVTFEARVPIAR